MNHITIVLRNEIEDRKEILVRHQDRLREANFSNDTFGAARRRAQIVVDRRILTFLDEQLADAVDQDI